MIVYRCICNSDIANLLGIAKESNVGSGKNTFKYNKDISYRHFYYFYDSALSFMQAKNITNTCDKVNVIMAYDIDDELLHANFGYGEYNIGAIPYKFKDRIYDGFDSIIFPEYAIDSKLITNDMIVGIGSEKGFFPVREEDRLYDEFKKNHKQFLKYMKWLYKKGMDVRFEKIQKKSAKLFPKAENNNELVKKNT